MKLIFVTKDPISKNIWKPVMHAAIARGHEVKITANENEYGDVGFYCDDRCLPGKQNFTVISINGLDQDHVIRPRYEEFFLVENWNVFDLGILPGKRWFEGLVRAANNHKCAPKIGFIEIGWPKSDQVFKTGDPLVSRSSNKKPRIVLYAPQTEQDGKQTQVVNAIKGTDYELWIKHWETEEQRKLYPDLLTSEYMENLNKENIYAKDSLSDVKLFDASQNFMDIVSKADLLITDQSSVLYEAALCGVPAITVKGWRHACGECAGQQPSPDVVLAVEFDSIKYAIDKIFTDYSFFVNQAKRIRAENFTNLGVASQKIIESIEEIIQNNNLKVPGIWINPLMDSQFYSKGSMEKRVIRRKVDKIFRIFLLKINSHIPKKLKKTIKSALILKKG